MSGRRGGERVTVQIRLLPSAEDLPLPKVATAGAAGMDLRAAITDDARLNAREVVAIPTGLCMAIPRGWEGQVRSRSGLALKGLVVANSPGTIDSDFRGEIVVVLLNISDHSLVVHRGDRVAQLVVAPVAHVEWDLVERLPPTRRGRRGLGSTGDE